MVLMFFHRADNKGRTPRRVYVEERGGQRDYLAY
jgi:hypothetical protein